MALTFTLALFFFCAKAAFAQTLPIAHPSFPFRTGASPRVLATPRSRKVAVSEEELEKWSRELRDKGVSRSYDALRRIASEKSSGALATRAALAVGYFEYTKARYGEAQKWLNKAAGDPLLREYALYWSGQTNIAQGRPAEAVVEMEIFPREFPDSVISDQALEALAQAALDAHKPDEALEALARAPAVVSSPDLLSLRAQAREQAGQPDQAAQDYLAIYEKYPLSSQADSAKQKLEALRAQLGPNFPAVSVELEASRAAALYNAKKWLDARSAYEELVPKLSHAAQERADLRANLCRAALDGDPSTLEKATYQDADVDAERLYQLSQIYRTRTQPAEMLDATEKTILRAPGSHWAEQALFSAGNSFWVLLDLDNAVKYYTRLIENFADASEVDAAQWRIAWAAYLAGRPEAISLMVEHLKHFPASPYTPDTLYWMGRLAESAGSPVLARGYYQRLRERFVQSYFARRAEERLAALGPGPSEQLPELAVIPPLAPMTPLGDAVPEAAEKRWERAQALRTIAFDSSAELELRAAYAESGEPRLLLEAAKEANNAGRYSVAVVTVRQIYPQLEAHHIEELPREVWLAAYPLPYEAELRRDAARAKIDPMLVAGLIRLESAFDPKAVSHAGAVGLMQVLPKTARKLSRQLHVRYARQRLFDPEYNLRVGTVYFASLLQQFHTLEAALAAYNAGEDRVDLWQSNRKYNEVAEFVDSIPFTETREYVQIVLRNADVYRQLYGEKK